MRALRFLVADVREGVRSIAFALIVVGLMTLLLGMVLACRAMLSGVGTSCLTWGDVVASVCGGMRVYDASSGLPFVMPVGWLLAMFLMFYVPLRYPYRNLMGFGTSAMIAAGSRRCWWFSKCAWLAVYVCLFWGCVLGVSAFLAFLLSGDMRLELTEQAAGLLSFDTWNLTSGRRQIAPFLFAAILMSYALVVAQCSLSLFIRPILSFSVMVALLFTSAFLFHPLLPGEYLMLARSNLVILDGFGLWDGVPLAVCIAVSSVCLGSVKFGKLDILDGGLSS